MTVAAVIAMIAIELAAWRSVFMGIKLMAKFFLMRRVIAVRIAVDQHIRSALYTGKEHGNHHKYAPKGFHSAAMVHRFARPGADLGHICPRRGPVLSAPIG